jgi:PGAP1-like protein.
MHKLIRWITASTAICILAGCCFHQKRFFRHKLYFVDDHHTLCATQPTHHETTLTIWIHGARPFAANTYNLGLKNLTLFAPKDYVAQSAYALIHACPAKFPIDHLYIYSWSGILDFSERQRAGTELYNELVNLIDTYKKLHGTVPKIRIIAHSHGGNVALNLVSTWDRSFFIDELILLAVPVQAKTQELVHSQLFKRVLNLYSTIDIPQMIDPQLFYRESGTYSLFSGQLFTPHENLMQVKIKINGAACQHLQFNDAQTLKILPQILDQLYQWMDKIPKDILTSHDARFMLSVYTNGRRTPRAKRYHNGDPYEHIELPYVEVQA